MSSRVELIMSALLAKLTAPAMTTVAATSIYRELYSALDSGFPAIVLEEGNEAPPDRPNNVQAARSLEVRLQVLIKGAAPYSLADAPMVEAFDRIMADRSLGGLVQDIIEGETTRERSQLEKPVAIVTKVFHLNFRTIDNSLN